MPPHPTLFCRYGNRNPNAFVFRSDAAYLCKNCSFTVCCGCFADHVAYCEPEYLREKGAVPSSSSSHRRSAAPFQSRDGAAAAAALGLHVDSGVAAAASDISNNNSNNTIFPASAFPLPVWTPLSPAEDWPARIRCPQCRVRHSPTLELFVSPPFAWVCETWRGEDYRNNGRGGAKTHDGGASNPIVAGRYTVILGERTRREKLYAMGGIPRIEACFIGTVYGPAVPRLPLRNPAAASASDTDGDVIVSFGGGGTSAAAAAGGAAAGGAAATQSSSLHQRTVSEVIAGPVPPSAPQDPLKQQQQQHSSFPRSKSATVMSNHYQQQRMPLILPQTLAEAGPVLTPQQTPQELINKQEELQLEIRRRRQLEEQRRNAIILQRSRLPNTMLLNPLMLGAKPHSDDLMLSTKNARNRAREDDDDQFALPFWSVAPQIRRAFLLVRGINSDLPVRTMAAARVHVPSRGPCVKEGESFVYFLHNMNGPQVELWWFGIRSKSDDCDGGDATSSAARKNRVKQHNDGDGDDDDGANCDKNGQSTAAAAAVPCHEQLEDAVPVARVRCDPSALSSARPHILEVPRGTSFCELRLMQGICSTVYLKRRLAQDIKDFSVSFAKGPEEARAAAPAAAAAAAAETKSSKKTKNDAASKTRGKTSGRKKCENYPADKSRCEKEKRRAGDAHDDDDDDHDDSASSTDTSSTSSNSSDEDDDDTTASEASSDEASSSDEDDDARFQILSKQTAGSRKGNIVLYERAPLLTVTILIDYKSDQLAALIPNNTSSASTLNTPARPFHQQTTHTTAAAAAASMLMTSPLASTATKQQPGAAASAMPTTINSGRKQQHDFRSTTNNESSHTSNKSSHSCNNNLTLYEQSVIHDAVEMLLTGDNVAICGLGSKRLLLSSIARADALASLALHVVDGTDFRDKSGMSNKLQDRGVLQLHVDRLGAAMDKFDQQWVASLRRGDGRIKEKRTRDLQRMLLTGVPTWDSGMAGDFAWNCNEKNSASMLLQLQRSGPAELIPIPWAVTRAMERPQTASGAGAAAASSCHNSQLDAATTFTSITTKTLSPSAAATTQPGNPLLMTPPHQQTQQPQWEHVVANRRGQSTHLRNNQWTKEVETRLGGREAIATEHDVMTDLIHCQTVAPKPSDPETRAADAKAKKKTNSNTTSSSKQNKSAAALVVSDVVKYTLPSIDCFFAGAAGGTLSIGNMKQENLRKIFGDLTTGVSSSSSSRASGASGTDASSGCSGTRCTILPDDCGVPELAHLYGSGHRVVPLPSNNNNNNNNGAPGNSSSIISTSSAASAKASHHGGCVADEHLPVSFASSSYLRHLVVIYNIDLIPSQTLARLADLLALRSGGRAVVLCCFDDGQFLRRAEAAGAASLQLRVLEAHTTAPYILEAASVSDQFAKLVEVSNAMAALAKAAQDARSVSGVSTNTNGKGGRRGGGRGARNQQQQLPFHPNDQQPDDIGPVQRAVDSLTENNKKTLAEMAQIQIEQSAHFDSIDLTIFNRILFTRNVVVQSHQLERLVLELTSNFLAQRNGNKIRILYPRLLLSMLRPNAAGGVGARL